MGATASSRSPDRRTRCSTRVRYSWRPRGSTSRSSAVLEQLYVPAVGDEQSTPWHGPPVGQKPPPCIAPAAAPHVPFVRLYPVMTQRTPPSATTVRKWRRYSSCSGRGADNTLARFRFESPSIRVARYTTVGITDQQHEVTTTRRSRGAFKHRESSGEGNPRKVRTFAPSPPTLQIFPS